MKSVLIKGVATLALALAGLSAQAGVYTATLTGAMEVPQNDSPGMGNITVNFDMAAHTMTIDVTFSGLEYASTVAHIHCCTADPMSGTAMPATRTPTLAGFPQGVMEGTYHQVFDTSDASFWNNGFINSHGGTTAGAESALLAGMEAGTAYFNIHSSGYPNGEIRGFLQPVPEPAQVALLALGAPLMLFAVRRRRDRPFA
ncbi:putative secreted protein with PEP-CTERM sorting signal [Pseudoduganella flava]|uniref:CHRD domain-containing protein n=1 Tax=Pseudoduganella flava TaxID=871742 RepID=A0A562PZ37_9BURK|nr:CHRD domain-containing protein [Pseudoduganella flava]QGZ38744.1 CHRD domain-containing protein [Pseudoduganella flava]TWI49679.1 putative secreted protein with PEP-CTERM sorting signal [Pseudoduganella flava]